VTTAHAITAAALANCLGTDSRTALDRAFAGDEAFSPGGAFCELPFPTVLGVMPGIDHQRGRKGPLWIDPRDATRGGVNGRASPGHPPEGGHGKAPSRSTTGKVNFTEDEASGKKTDE
jgi:hypothetical protein